MPAKVQSDQGTLINRAPFLAPLLFIISLLEFTERGIPYAIGLLASLLIILALFGLLEPDWDKTRIQIAGVLLVLAIVISALIFVRSRQRPLLYQSFHGRCIIAERRALGQTLTFRLEDENGDGWLWQKRGEFDSLSEGMAFELTADIEQLDKDKDGNFNEFRYWRARGVLGKLSNVRCIRELKPAFSLHSFRQRIRERLSILPQRVRELTAAVLLGDRGRQISQNHQRWGTTYLLAVSGWHVGLCLSLCCIIWGSGRLALMMSSAVLWFYVFLSGEAMSAVRAAVMLQTGILGLLFGRRGTGINTVAFAGCLMLLINPLVFWDTGWQLSMIAAMVLSCLTGVKKFALFFALAVSPILWFLTSPLVGQMSGALFLSSLPINLMAMPCFSFLLPASLLSAVPALLKIPGAQYFGQPIELLLILWEKCADQWIDWVPKSLLVGTFPFWLCGGVLLGILGIGLHLRTWRIIVMTITGSLFLFFMF